MMQRHHYDHALQHPSHLTNFNQGNCQEELDILYLCNFLRYKFGHLGIFDQKNILLSSSHVKKGVLTSKVKNLACSCGLSGFTLIVLASLNWSRSLNFSAAALESYGGFKIDILFIFCQKNSGLSTFSIMCKQTYVKSWMLCNIFDYRRCSTKFLTSKYDFLLERKIHRTDVLDTSWNGYNSSVSLLQQFGMEGKIPRENSL